jgi:hypothetical protein
MSRRSFEPQDFGVNMTRDDFDDRICDAFNATYRGQWTIDEMLLHPAEAMRFCSDVRRSMNAYDVPDDIILRVILARRKQG